MAVLDWLLLMILDVPDAWLWALLAFVTNFVPNIGFLIGLIPPAVISLLTQDWQSAVIIVVGYSVLNVVVQTLIQPKVVGDRVQLNTTLTFVALVLWTWILGGLGAILAIPMTLLVRALFVDSRPNLRWVHSLFSSDAGPRRRKKETPAARKHRSRRHRRSPPGTGGPGGGRRAGTRCRDRLRSRSRIRLSSAQIVRVRLLGGATTMDGPTSTPGLSEPTIYDVARAAGVAPSTVSRALSKPGRVSFKTAERIRQVAEELGYRSGRIERSISSGAPECWPSSSPTSPIRCSSG